VHPITKLELVPAFPQPLEGGVDPPPPIVTAPKAVEPFTGILFVSKTPPAPPPPPRFAPPLPPPATTKVSTNLVPGCVVTALGVLDVFVVIVFAPRDVMFTGPIIPPLPAII
jgi:hypothetical protein